MIIFVCKLSPSRIYSSSRNSYIKYAFVTEILDPSLGEIESSVQMNFMVDIGWLLGHYYFAGCL